MKLEIVPEDAGQTSEANEAWNCLGHIQEH